MTKCEIEASFSNRTYGLLLHPSTHIMSIETHCSRSFVGDHELRNELTLVVNWPRFAPTLGFIGTALIGRIPSRKTSQLDECLLLLIDARG
mmetsp:Transcript_33341/g.49392  ORF Transcript_33341/g.49392 Transcript_33341/m.49392 type:complete len:91 (-) Transcript_33341:253-525(-)